MSGATPFDPVTNPLVTFTNSDNLQDSNATEALNSRAVELVRLADGSLVMITSELGAAVIIGFAAGAGRDDTTMPATSATAVATAPTTSARLRFANLLNW